MMAVGNYIHLGHHLDFPISLIEVQKHAQCLHGRLRNYSQLHLKNKPKFSELRLKVNLRL